LLTFKEIEWREEKWQRRSVRLRPVWIDMQEVNPKNVHDQLEEKARRDDHGSPKQAEEKARSNLM